MIALGTAGDAKAWTATSCAVYFCLPAVRTYYFRCPTLIISPPSNGDSCIAQWHGRDPYEMSTFYSDPV